MKVTRGSSTPYSSISTCGAIAGSSSTVNLIPSQVLRYVRDQDAWPVASRVEKAHADDVVPRVAVRQWTEDRVRPVQVERHRARWWIDIAARTLRDAEEKDCLAVELRRSCVESRDHLEVGLRWLYVARRYQRVLLEA